MHLALIAGNAIALLVYMTLCFRIAYTRGRIDTVDAAWGGGFVVVAALVAGLETSISTVLMLVLIDIWAIRLGSHIIERHRKSDSDDPRYLELVKKWGKQNPWPRAYVSIFLLQGLLVLIISLPVVFAAGEAVAWATPIMVLGAAVWLKGFVVEVVADHQLRQFLSSKANKGKVLDAGLWRYSRHPNYLGEITQWYGLGIIACASSWGWIGLIGPLTLNVLIRYVSGVPPIENRKQKDPAYAAYMSRTNAILPSLSKVRGRLAAARQ